MTFAVCDFTQSPVSLVTVVKVHNAGSKVFNWTVIVAFEIHCGFAHLQAVSEVCFSLIQRQNVATCSSINLAVNLEDL